MVWRQSGREWPDEAAIRSWVAAALPAERQLAELTIRVVDHAEARMLNREYRGRDYATNVLSFPAELPHGVGLDWLGDIVVCGPVVEAEALAQGKSQRAHFAHLVIHGTLHLLGLDHEDDAEATIMEGSECAILARLGYADPYADDEQ
ncbi:MAG: rRNA maturation RNase YbeY [Pseudomonadota bacterium]